MKSAMLETNRTGFYIFELGEPHFYDLWTCLYALYYAGINLSLLSRVMSSRLSRGTYNGGLLSTEAGTIARVIADATITVAGYLGVGTLLNITLLPSLFICIISIVATCYTYNSLYWFLWLSAIMQCSKVAALELT